MCLSLSCKIASEVWDYADGAKRLLEVMTQFQYYFSISQNH